MELMRRLSSVFSRRPSEQQPTAVATPIITTEAIQISANATNSKNGCGGGGISSVSMNEPRTDLNGIAMEIYSEYPTYRATEPVSTMIGINIVAPPAPEDNDRAAVECVVVSDVSGSMGGSKISLLKQATKLLLDELVSKDRVSLVTFDTEIKECLPLSAVTEEAKAKANKIVDTFKAGTSTNLSGGLFRGITQFSSADADKRNSIRTVLLMTDGQANHGLCTKAQITPVVTSMLRGRGISVHTFGYGSDHDSDLLRAISNAGNGSYYFVDEVDALRSAFGDCLGGILSVVAQNLELEIEAVNGAMITKVHHRDAVVLEETKRYRIPYHDLYGEEKRDVLVSMRLGASGKEIRDSALDEAQFIRATLRYVDVLNGKSASVSASAGARRLRGAIPHLDLAKDPRIELQATRLRVADALDDARAFAECGSLERARTRIRELQGSLERLAETSAEGTEASVYNRGWRDDLVECADGLANMSQYRSITKHKMANIQEMNYQQRSMASHQLAESSATYKTKAKKSRASKFSSSLKFG